jgi:hypothetical protein
VRAEDRKGRSCVRAHDSRHAGAARVPPSASARPTSIHCAFYEKGRSLPPKLSEAGDFDTGIQRALEALLVSPDFLFRVERDPVRAMPGKAYPVSDLELASRLSFFLWSSIPDDQLLDLAERGRLKNPHCAAAAGAADARRPALRCARSNFAGQWLHLRNVETVQPDPVIFPFDEALRARVHEGNRAVRRQHRPRGSQPARSADGRLHVRQRAAGRALRHSEGLRSQFRRVTLTDPNRAGCWARAAS